MSSRRFNFYRPTTPHQYMTPVSLQDAPLYEKNILGAAGYGFGGHNGSMVSTAFAAGPQGWHLVVSTFLDVACGLAIPHDMWT